MGRSRDPPSPGNRGAAPANRSAQRVPHRRERSLHLPSGLSTIDSDLAASPGPLLPRRLLGRLGRRPRPLRGRPGRRRLASASDRRAPPRPTGAGRRAVDLPRSPLCRGPGPRLRVFRRDWIPHGRRILDFSRPLRRPFDTSGRPRSPSPDARRTPWGRRCRGTPPRGRPRSPFHSDSPIPSSGKIALPKPKGFRGAGGRVHSSHRPGSRELRRSAVRAGARRRRVPRGPEFRRMGPTNPARAS